MEAYLIDWLNLLVRWLHFITGIAWIGSSFYFIWLDNHLQAPRDPADTHIGVGGEVWSVHGGGFYHAQKYKSAPTPMPETLHWFKWEAYATWLSGMFLLVFVYWYGAEIYLIDPAVAEISATTAVAIAAALIVAGWFIYDLLCRSPLGKNETGFGIVLLVLVSLLAWGLCQLFGGRGAYIHFGAILGTIMVANVFFIIIPGQKQMVAAAARGETPDPAPGLRAKQRSVHNTYFTLPVLFVMTSNHFSMTYASEYNWLVLIGISLAGALVRIYFVARHKGVASPLPVVLAALLMLGVVLLLAPQRTETQMEASFADVRRVVQERCVSCHSATPTHPAFPAAPAGVVLDNDAQIVAEAVRIHQQTVLTKAMPIGNLTHMSSDERKMIDAWFKAGAAGDTP